MGIDSAPSSSDADDLQSMYSYFCEQEGDDNVIFQRTQHIMDSLFYTSVETAGRQFCGLLDSGSMACTMSAETERILLDCGGSDISSSRDTDVIVVGCGGVKVKPKCIYDLKMTVYGIQMRVPVLVIPGQADAFIIGTNVIKHLLHCMKNDKAYWKLLKEPDAGNVGESAKFLGLMANLERWRGHHIPDKIGTVKLKKSVTLQPRTEHIIWGKLPMRSDLSIGSAVIVEPPTSRTLNRNVIVGRVVAPLWGDGWVPVKVLNPLDEPLTLRRNSKLADVSPCIALVVLRRSNRKSMETSE